MTWYSCPGAYYDLEPKNVCPKRLSTSLAVIYLCFVWVSEARTWDLQLIAAGIRCIFPQLTYISPVSVWLWSQTSHNQPPQAFLCDGQHPAANTLQTAFMPCDNQDLVINTPCLPAHHTERGLSVGDMTEGGEKQ